MVLSDVQSEKGGGGVIIQCMPIGQARCSANLLERLVQQSLLLEPRFKAHWILSVVHDFTYFFKLDNNIKLLGINTMMYIA